MGDPLYFIFRYRLTMIDNAGFVPGATVLFKLQPFTDDLDFDIDSITPISYTISGFADIPRAGLFACRRHLHNHTVVALSTAPSGFTARYTG